MNKKISIALGLALILGLGAGTYFYMSKSESTISDGQNVSDVQTNYKVAITSSYTSPLKQSTILDLEGDLLAHLQGDEQIVSEWSSFSKFIAMDAPGIPTTILNAETVSAVDEDAEWKHFVDSDFPSQYTGFQKEVLSRIFVPVPIRPVAELYRNEREGKNLFKVLYTIRENKEGFELIRSWIQTVQGQVRIDPKENGFRYQYDKDAKLVSMQGTLSYLGVDHENQDFRLTTKIFVNAKDTRSLASEKRKFRDRQTL
ncbi:MAG: hypothetical protein EOP04_25460, partial [Proteobacteria bacterium]